MPKSKNKYTAPIDGLKAVLSEAAVNEVQSIMDDFKGRKDIPGRLLAADRITRAVVVDLDGADGKFDGVVEAKAIARKKKIIGELIGPEAEMLAIALKNLPEKDAFTKDLILKSRNAVAKMLGLPDVAKSILEEMEPTIVPSYPVYNLLSAPANTPIML